MDMAAGGHWGSYLVSPKLLEYFASIESLLLPSRGDRDDDAVSKQKYLIPSKSLNSGGISSNHNFCISCLIPSVSMHSTPHCVLRGMYLLQSEWCDGAKQECFLRCLRRALGRKCHWNMQECSMCLNFQFVEFQFCLMARPGQCRSLLWLSTVWQRHCRKRILKQTWDLWLLQPRYWKHSRVLLIFPNEVIFLILEPWSKTSLVFGTSSLFSFQQLPGAEGKLKNGITLNLFPLFFLCCLALPSVSCCLQELPGNSRSWWQHLHVFYTGCREIASI